jgi:hypothetical protein
MLKALGGTALSSLPALLGDSPLGDFLNSDVGSMAMDAVMENGKGWLTKGMDLIKGGGQNLLAQGGNLLNSMKPGEMLKNIAKNITQAGGIKGVLKQAAKGGVLSTLFEGFFAFNDIREMLATEKDQEKLKTGIGQRILKGGSSVMFSTLLSALVTAAGAPFLAYGTPFIGNWLGGKASEILTEYFPGITSGIGGVVVDMFGDKQKNQAVPVKDAVIPADGSRYMSTGAGELLKVSPKDTMIAVDLEAGRKQPKASGGNGKLEQLIEELIVTVKASSSKDIVIKVNEREIGRAAFNQFAPRAAG